LFPNNLLLNLYREVEVDDNDDDNEEQEEQNIMDVEDNNDAPDDIDSNIKKPAVAK
jgi:hypothetical protein